MSQQIGLLLLSWLLMYWWIQVNSRSRQARTVLRGGNVTGADQLGGGNINHLQLGNGKCMNLQQRDELCSGQKASQESSSSLAQEGRLRRVVQNLPQVIEKRFAQRLRKKILCYLTFLSGKYGAIRNSWGRKKNVKIFLKKIQDVIALLLFPGNLSNLIARRRQCL